MLTRGRGRWTALLVSLVLFSGSILFGRPADASSSATTYHDYIRNGDPCAGSYVGMAGTNSMDGDDATYVSGGLSGYGFSQTTAIGRAINSSCNATPLGFRLKVDATGVAIDQVDVQCYVTAQGGWHTAFTSGSIRTASYDQSAGRVDLTTPSYCHSDGTGAGALTSVQINVTTHGCNSCTLRVYLFEMYEVGSTVPISNYCSNMAVGHPQFSWTWTCTLNQAFTGTITLTSSPAGTFYTDSIDPGVAHNPSATYTGDFQKVNQCGTYSPCRSEISGHQDCWPLCQSDQVTLSIVDTTHSQSTSFVFLRSMDGAVQLPEVAPVLRDWHGCFNVAANDCGNGGGAGTTDIWFSFYGTYSNYSAGPSTDAVNIKRVAASGYAGDASAKQAAVYYVTRYGLATNTSTDSNVWVISVYNNVSGDYQDVTLNFSTGGKSSGGSRVVPGDPTSQFNCTLTSIGDCFASIFAISGQALEDFWWGTDDDPGIVRQLRDDAMTRQPFNYILRAWDGVSAQITRAQGAESASSTCAGVTLAFPDPGVFNLSAFGNSYSIDMWPNSVPLPTFHVLSCEWIEPWGGTTWWQTLRNGFFGPAVYLGFAYSQLRRLRPKTQVTG